LVTKRQRVKVPLICIVDDDESLVEAMVSLIQSVGYKAKGFVSAEDFLKSRQLHHATCLILDVRMPTIGGFELQRRLAAGNYRIPTIFITAYESDDIHMQALQAQAAGVLCKPFSQESLFQAVSSALVNQPHIEGSRFAKRNRCPQRQKHFDIPFDAIVNNHQPVKLLFTMKNIDTHKVVLPAGDNSGKTNPPAFAQIMNLLIRILSKLGLLKEDLDYHLVRASMVIIYLFFGYQKWFPYEAHTLIPFISNGPLISWMYPVFGIQGASWFLGVSEWLFGALLFLGYWNKRLGILGALGSCVTFLMTITIIPFMPDGWAASAGGFPAMQGNVAFLMKDLVLFAVSFYLLKQDVMRLSLSESAKAS
jgi:uncharacterized membrane protein YkgB/CheY-like chemotaxis protein